MRAKFEEPINPLVRLEETFTAYVGALQSRKGNVVGKVLRNRSTADELAVSELYNTFVENPFDTRAATEASVDVLFVAFEKFLRLAWRDQVGPVMSLLTLQALEEKSMNLYPGDFADFLKLVLGEIAPQNKRAFMSIVKLLADLLDGCGNDGDRGALTAAFAELMVIEGEPHDFIALLDRLVEDYDRLFDDIGTGASVSTVTPGYSSSSWNSKMATNTGSLTSNASSLRRRFGFDTLLRQNSKNDSDSKHSVWRTLSKSSHKNVTPEGTPSSLSKGSVGRARSVEAENRPPSPGKTRDRPTVLGAFEERPASSDTLKSYRLSTIRASPPIGPTKSGNTLKKKQRRSSLSDLKDLTISTTLIDVPPSIAPLGARKMPQSNRPHRSNTGPRTPSPSKIPANRSLHALTSPTSNQKENSPLPTRTIGSLSERSQNLPTEEPASLSSRPSIKKGHTKTVSLSHIPMLRSTYRERGESISTPPNRPITSSTGASTVSKSSITMTPTLKTPTLIPSPQKLRLQSPIRLRERLQNEARAIECAESSLQSELAKIGEEMRRLSAGPTARSNPSELQRASESLRTLEDRIPQVVQELTTNNELVKKDLEGALKASEDKFRSMDQLYREVTAENELLYERFNGELGKIVKALRGKGRDANTELLERLKESGEETGKLRRENARLRRENLSLRALLQE
jgi:hypothetical protein